MCSNPSQIVVNGRTMLVPCGHCKACLQERAQHGAQIIRDTYDKDTTVLFITLTYHNDCIPYVQFDDDSIYSYPGSGSLDNEEEVIVYRDSSQRFISTSFGSSKTKLRRIYDFHAIGSFYSKCYYPTKQMKFLRSYNKMHQYRYYKRIGVLWYPDVQNFVKRLRQIVLRENIYEDYFQVFSVGEYGETTCRPHFHTLLFIKGFEPRDLSKWQYAVSKAWSYDDSHRTYANTEIARSPASYVASYLNCASFVPYFLRQKPIAPKTLHSIHMGLSPVSFSAASVSEKIRRRNIVYNLQRVSKNVGVSDTSVLIPQYVLRTYFPRVKGYSRLTNDEIVDVYQNPQNLSRLCKKLGYTEHLNVVKDSSGRDVLKADGTQKLLYLNDLTNNKRLIDRCFTRWYNALFGDIGLASADEIFVARSEWAFLCRDCWNIRNSFIIKDSMSRCKELTDWIDNYDNWQEFINKIKRPVNKHEKTFFSPLQNTSFNFEYYDFDFDLPSFPDGFKKFVLSSDLSVVNQKTRVQKSKDLALRFDMSSKERKVKQQFIVDDWQHNTVYF